MALSTRQQCNLVSCDVTRDLVRYVLARWRAKRTPVIVCRSQIAYNLA